MEITRDHGKVLGKPNVSRETSQNNLLAEVVIVANKPYSEHMREMKDMETLAHTENIKEIAALAEQLHQALKALAGPSGRMTSWWDGKPADWPAGLPWDDETIARASSAVSCLTIEEEDGE